MPGTIVAQQAEMIPLPSRAMPLGVARAEPATVDWNTLDRLHAPILSQEFMIQGAASCAAASCHGGPRPHVSQPAAKRGSEYQLWKEHDPHARSWATISSPASVAMMQRLGIMTGGQIVDRAGFDNCLACHNTTKRFDEPRSLADHREGVGCAGCHGPSQRWAGIHYRYDFAPQLAAADGFVNTGDLYVRARMCASCHVGDKDRDMNHDIIAAGHPPLKYELATYHARQPKHWRDPESRNATYYEAQLWLAGQVAATDASLSLLNARASQRQPVSRWPELAAYDCASCHHSLGLRDNRHRTKFAARAPFSSWNDSGLRWLIDYRQSAGEATNDDWALLKSLDDVKELMESAAIADAPSVAKASSDARKALAAWYDSSTAATLRQTFRSEHLGFVLASAAGKPQTFSAWESSVQFYLAAVAARASWPGGWDGALRDVSESLRIGLSYPQNLDINQESGIRGQPTISADEAMQLGILLAGSLGPIHYQQPPADDDDSEQLRRELREMIEQINQRWDKIRTEGDVETEIAPPEAQPRREPKTQAELLEELRRRNRNQDAN